MNDSAPGSLSVVERDRLGSIALDQWRGLALVLVLVSHGFYFTERVSGIGRVGVNLFFFISGILVYRTLSRSRAANDWDRARSFWWRRFRRLYPALLVYLAVMLPALLWLQNLPTVNAQDGCDFHSCWHDVWMALLYVTNYHPYPGAPMPYGHLWSLGCEMQFYLLAPLIFLAGGQSLVRRTTFFGVLLVLLLGLGLMEPVLVKLTANWNTHVISKYHFEFAVWPMMAGFFCEYRREWFSRLPRAIITGILWASMALCAGGFGLMLAGHDVKLLVIAVGALLLLPCLQAYLYGRPWSGWWGACLRWLGERTYSIYLWQQPLTLCNFLPNHWHPLGALLAVLIGALSFRAVEYPFLSVNRQKKAPAR